MGAAKRLIKFGGGGVLGAAVGAAVGVLWAPQRGEDLKRRLSDLARRARIAGAEAKAAKEDELIRKYRLEVNDPDALRSEEERARLEAAETVATAGLGLNAPGALAAQEAALRATAPAAGYPTVESDAPGEDLEPVQVPADPERPPASVPPGPRHG